MTECPQDYLLEMLHLIDYNEDTKYIGIGGRYIEKN